MQEDTNTCKKKFSFTKDFPTTILKLSIFEKLSDKDLARFSNTSSIMFSHSKMFLEKRKEIAEERAAAKLLSHVVKGEARHAMDMIRSYPRLLLIASTATDYSNRPYNNRTPFQAALLCHDVTLWKEIEPCFDMLEDGETEKNKQFNALFSEGIPQGRPYDFSVLIQAITNSPDANLNAALQKTQNETAICLALNSFRIEFNALAMQETFFNPSHLIEALKVYNEQFDNWSWAQRDLFWRQVIGYTQRFLPTCLAQAFVQLLFYIVQDRQPLVRSLKFKYDRGSYYPLLDSSGLGFDFGICGSVLGFVAVPGSVGRDRASAYLYDKLCRANTTELRRLECGVQRNNDTLTSRSCCTIS